MRRKSVTLLVLCAVLLPLSVTVVRPIPVSGAVTCSIYPGVPYDYPGYGIDLGYCPNRVYYVHVRWDGTSWFGKLSPSGDVLDLFEVFPATVGLAFSAHDLGFGPNLFYYVRNDPADANATWFGTTSIAADVTDRFKVGANFDALVFVAMDLGYGPNLFYYVRHDPADGNASWFGTISASGEATDRFEVGTGLDGLSFVAKDLGYGPNLFYYTRHETPASSSTFGSFPPIGGATDRLALDADLTGLTFVAPYIGYQPDSFYGVEPSIADPWPGMLSLATLTAEGPLVERFGVGFNFRALAFPDADPMVGFPDHPASYAIDEWVSIACTATDVAGWTDYWPYEQVVATDCPSAGYAASFGPGTHELIASAIDAVGNVGSASTSFSVSSATYPSMKNVTPWLVYKSGVASQLVSYLDAAAKAEARGNLKAEASNLDSYRKLLTAQIGKAITREDAGRLIAFSYDL